MQEINQGAGYQKVAKPKTQDIVFNLANMPIYCGNPKGGPVAMGCNRVAKWQPAFCKDYYEIEKIVNSY